MHGHYRRNISRTKMRKIPLIVKNIKYTQNKYIWMKAAMAIMTTDTYPKMAMEECEIGNVRVKILELQRIRHDTTKHSHNTRLYLYRRRYTK